MRPTWFWLLGVTLPYFMLLDHFFQAVVARHPILATMGEQPWPVRFSVVALVLAAWPMGCSLVIQDVQSLHAKRDSLRRLFATHCIALGPASLLLFLAMLLPALFDKPSERLMTSLLALFTATSLYSQTAIAYLEVRSWGGRARVVVGCFLRTFVVALAVTSLAAVMIGGARGTFSPAEAPGLGR